MALVDQTKARACLHGNCNPKLNTLQEPILRKQSICLAAPD
jgi:hypothetical protein